MTNPNAPFYPIIYVRGYAMTPNDIDETSADPFCGFNLGSTVYRAVVDRNDQPRKYIFQSPVVRLVAEFNYKNAYENGNDILDPEWDFDIDGRPTGNKISIRTIIIFRYYDEASRLLGSGQTPSIDTFSKELARLILRVRDLVCKNPENQTTPDDFRCYLVAHSMGGLVCRAFLQNTPADTSPEEQKNMSDARKTVDKFFTYATPHNGIDMAGMNVPKWLTPADMDNFNRTTMAAYLGLKDRMIHYDDERVDWLPEEQFPIDRVFCMVATNRLDYNVALGLSRVFCGSGSDGLVKIENATLWELKENGDPGLPCAKAFSFRSHSGYFGIVNGEESYQNLIRFLFGDFRVAIWLDVEKIRLPPALQERQNRGESVKALYQIELLVSPRAKLWYLSRRKSEEDSVACISHQSWLASSSGVISTHLSTVFLAKRARADKEKNTVAYSVFIGVKKPDYEINHIISVNDHYEGTYLFQGTVIIEITFDIATFPEWSATYYWEQSRTGAPPTPAPLTQINSDKFELLLPLPTDDQATPGITGKIRFIISKWNQDAMMEE